MGFPVARDFHLVWSFRDKTPSWILLGIFLLAFGGAIACLALCAIESAIQWLLIFWISGQFIQTVRVHGLRWQRKSIMAFGYESDNRWWLLTKEGNILTVHLQKTSIVTCWVVGLHFKSVNEGKRYAVWIFRGDGSMKEWRRLRCRLLWGLGN